MLEALWTIEFGSYEAFGAGVVVFETGRIFGGDNQYYYIGNYDVKNDTVEGEVEVTHYSGPGYSVFGRLQKFHLKLSGKLQEPIMELQGFLIESPDKKIWVRCTKRAELP